MLTKTINKTALTLLQGNIVEVEAEAIVNAANSGLTGGGGVDGAIHRAAGPALKQECQRIGGCPTGSAVATSAGYMRARYIFHAVGPVYGHHPNPEALLKSAYQACFALAKQYHVKSIAFPSLSTGAYRYPLPEAALIALRTTIEQLQQPTSLEHVQFVLFDQRAYAIFERTLHNLLQP
ncbi:O-acetyl-ADP-ribose deacetylase (regulator of RNase III) [Thermosporothrix hazakensis]|jgi:O-acetyl-ADP-ribose deacetylase (regulator of RNase III)|uniref:O-acetyl-ADP-ribose deacetylase (Regulator of RNase III) n=1 Tax=Thermosporothrix hazakensis TaxID=644383 RepID=A0A326U1N4_THEHA|nr:macro domain-containing protein [Thermosporothrix hazakensis]PZW23964.1 O-acetyl-ADP-ribose deacetylase (regulator of RNase III) [Thermosporothrix hazakensis]GCE48437.1 O-acetyl-ADP-ribose deacetylase [Thermosporothrix hazakensis]